MRPPDYQQDAIKLHRADCMEIMTEYPDNHFDLVAVDPPYYKTKGAFDFVWRTFADYLEDVERWAAECARILSTRGTLIWWGSAAKIAYTQVIVDRHLSLLNSAVWRKTDAQTQKNSPDALRRLLPVTERLLLYCKDGSGECPANQAENRYKKAVGDARTRLMEPLVSYLIDEMTRAGFDVQSVNQATGTSMASHWFARTSQWSLPTETWYNRLRQIFNAGKPGEYLKREYEDLKREYEYLKREYEDLRRPFANPQKLADVLEFSQESHLTRAHDHPTQKPPTLTRALFRTCTRGGRAFVPFVGSGTEVVEAASLGLSVVGCELDPDYFAAACTRVRTETRQLELF